MKTTVIITLMITMGAAGPGIAHAQGKLNKGSDTPIEKGGPYDRVYHSENAPAPGDGSAFPQEWLYAYGNPARNAASSRVANNAPAWVRNGVSWQFAEARSWPLKKKALRQ